MEKGSQYLTKILDKISNLNPGLIEQHWQTFYLFARLNLDFFYFHGCEYRVADYGTTLPKIVRDFG